MDVIGKSIEAILYPHKTEKIFMKWINYIFLTGGGIVWVIIYWSLYLIPFKYLSDKYTPQSMIAWGVMGLILTVATLWKRFKVDPKQERELKVYMGNFFRDFTIIKNNFGGVRVLKNLIENSPEFEREYEKLTDLTDKFDDFIKTYDHE